MLQPGAGGWPEIQNPKETSASRNPGMAVNISPKMLVLGAAANRLL